jgi:nucleoside-diphosphate-sugar epimerase
MRLVADIESQIEWVFGDVTDIVALEEAMSGVKQVYHCAAIISYVKRNAEKMMRINGEGTANVVNVALDSGIDKLVHVSSIAALGRTGKQGEVVTEAAPWDRKFITSDYAVSKFVGEREVWRAIAEGLPAVILNPSIIVGAGNWNSGSCKLFSTVYDGFKFYTEGITGYVDVRDVVQSAYIAMESDVTEQRFIVNGDNWTNKQFLQTIAAHLQVKGPHVHAGKNLSELAWRVEWLKSVFTGKEPSVTKQTARIANKVTYFSNAKLKQTFDFDCRPLSISIADTAASFLAEKRDGKFHPLSF